MIEFPSCPQCGDDVRHEERFGGYCSVLCRLRGEDIDPQAGDLRALIRNYFSDSGKSTAPLRKKSKKRVYKELGGDPPEDPNVYYLTCLIIEEVDPQTPREDMSSTLREEHLREIILRFYGDEVRGVVEEGIPNRDPANIDQLVSNHTAQELHNMVMREAENEGAVGGEPGYSKHTMAKIYLSLTEGR